MTTNQIFSNADTICENFNQDSTNVKLQVCKNSELLARFYKTYDGVKEFLYIAPEDEIAEAIQNGAVFFTVLYNGQLAGVAKASNLTLPYPFFCVPSTMDASGNYWGLSGLYIHKNFRGKKLSTILLKASTSLADLCKANGIYADFDYRNIASMQLVSKYYNLIGYTDGRNGSPDEATIYTTFYKDFTNASQNGGDLSIVFEKLNLDSARLALDLAMKKVGKKNVNIVPYCDGYNEVVCFERPYAFNTSNIKIMTDITKNYNKESVDKSL